MELVVVHHLSKLCHLRTRKHPHQNPPVCGSLLLDFHPTPPNREPQASAVCEAPRCQGTPTHPLTVLHHAADVLQRLEVLGVHRAELHNFVIHLQALKTGENQKPSKRWNAFLVIFTAHNPTQWQGQELGFYKERMANSEQEGQRFRPLIQERSVGHLILEVPSGADLANGVQVCPAEALRTEKRLKLPSGVSEPGSRARRSR